MTYELTIVQYPTGKFGFAGTVPAKLKYEYESEEDLQTVTRFGPSITQAIAESQGRVFAVRTWKSREAAKAEARNLGYEVV